MVFSKTSSAQRNLSSIISNRSRSNILHKIVVNKKGSNKSSLRFEPNLQYNDEFISQLLRKFLFTRYSFHKDKLEVVYRDFIEFIRAKKQYSVKKNNINLGAGLMREMVQNYDKSLPRKRQFWENWVDKRINKHSPKMDLLREKLPKEDLISLMKKFTLKKIAYIHGVGYRTLMDYKRNLNINSRDRSPENS